MNKEVFYNWRGLYFRYLAGEMENGCNHSFPAYSPRGNFDVRTCEYCGCLFLRYSDTIELPIINGPDAA